MQLNFKFKTIILIIFFIFSINNFSFSQTNSDYDLMISWETSNFVPAEFKGKILPSPRSEIKVAIEFMQNNKIVDLSKEKIYWYINNELISNSLGIKQVNFLAPNDSVVDVRVELPNFDIIKTIEIPITKPKLIINVPFPNKEIHVNNFKLYAIPYFFNLKNNDLDYLNIKWKINNSPAKPYNYNPFQINIEITNNNPLNILVEAEAQNIENQFEIAGDSVNLTFIK